MIENWISSFAGNGTLVGNLPHMPMSKLGHHMFPSLSDFVTPPELDQHYIGVMLNGGAQIEAQRSGRNFSTQASDGTIFLVAAGERVAWRWDKPTDEVQIFLSPGVVNRVARDCGLGKVEIPSHIFIVDDAISSVVRMLKSDLARIGPDTKLIIEYGVQFISAHLIKNYCGPLKPLASTRYSLSKKQLARLDDYVKDNLSNSIDLDDLSGLVRLSKFHFARMFKESVGCPPHTWLTEKRMQRSKELIEQTSLPILAIANSVGFQSQSHFGQTFKKWYGISPLGARRAAT